MFKKKPILEYEVKNDAYPELISPAKSKVPDWYKKIPKHKNDEIFNLKTGFDLSLKACIPFLDSLTCGYLITLPYDLYVKNNNGAPYLTWKPTVQDPPGFRNKVADENLVPFGCYPCEYFWNMCLSMRIPKGYSFLLTHPLNRHDLPFTTLSGIVDGDMATASYGEVPFYIKNGFEGIISQGTPIAQIIPFRQEKWKLFKKPGLVQEGNRTGTKSGLVISGWYKNTFWTKKDYS